MIYQSVDKLMLLFDDNISAKHSTQYNTYNEKDINNVDSNILQSRTLLLYASID